ncbi:MAG: rhomboid family intramembrane serine protease, partial [Bacteroidia bacterium]
MTVWEEVKYKLFNSSSAVNQLLWINILAFAFSCLLVLIFHLSGLSANPLLVYLNVPADLGLVITRPWTFFTYQFMHAGPWHIFGNMLMFFYMGSILQDFLGSKKIWVTYLGGGIAGAILFLIMYNIFPVFASERNGFLIGAS